MGKETIKEPVERINLFCVISKSTLEESCARDIQTNSTWKKNPYGDDYAIVPDEMVDDIIATKGFCDIELNSEGTEVVSFVAKEIPEMPEIQRMPTTEERLVALEMAMLEQIGVVTE